jgi:hypothetical protein
MSEPENFLARWSRRKREIEDLEAKKPEEAPAGESASDPTSPQDTVEAAGAEGAADKVPESENFDLASLPPLGSITAETDISGYFARGVPADLARAALRRVWTSDPAIRDFVGLSENAWDFNAPETIPGFGPITASDDVAGMMRQMMGEVQTATRQLGPAPDQEAAPQAAEVPEHLSIRQAAAIDPIGDAEAERVLPPDRRREETPAGRDAGEVGVPMPETEAEAAEFTNTDPIRLRSHGGALPK